MIWRLRGRPGRSLKNCCSWPYTALRSALFLAYPFDVSRSLHAVRFASGHPRAVFEHPASQMKWGGNIRNICFSGGFLQFLYSWSECVCYQAR